MAERLKQVVYSPVDIDDGDYIDMETDPKLDAENIEFEKFKTEMHDSQDDAKITVGKKLTDSRGRPIGRQTFECFECGIDDYTFSQLCSRIRDDYGTGIYQIIGRDSNGKYKFRKTIGVQAPISIDNKPASNDVGLLIDKFSDAMERQQARTELMIKDLIGPRHGGDAIEQISKLALAIGPILKAFNIGGQPAKTMMDQMLEFKMMKEIIGEFSDGDGGRVDNFWGAIAEAAKSFGGPLMQAIAMAQRNGQLDANGLIPAPKALNAPAHVPTPSQGDDMKQKLNFLLNQAKAQNPPQDVADFILDAIPDDAAFDALETFLKDDTCIEQCQKVLPEIAQYNGWFARWREIMLKELAVMVDELTTDNEVSDTHVSGAGEADTRVNTETVNHAANASAANTVNANDDTRRGGGHQSNA